jgi:hypothetical protein
MFTSSGSSGTSSLVARRYGAASFVTGLPHTLGIPQQGEKTELVRPLWVVTSSGQCNT